MDSRKSTESWPGMSGIHRNIKMERKILVKSAFVIAEALNYLEKTSSFFMPVPRFLSPGFLQ